MCVTYTYIIYVGMRIHSVLITSALVLQLRKLL